MALPTTEKIGYVANGDINTAAELDSCGFLVAPGEDSEAFSKRLTSLVRKIEDFENKLNREKIAEPHPGLVIDSSLRMSPEFMKEGASVTERLYSFSIDWVLGFFPVKGLGPLWGGCSVSEYGDIPPLFVIRRDFLSKKHWFIYSREELLSHELCHVARAPLADRVYEEHFAYAASSSALRRYIGNCFRTEYDAILFILPIFLLLGVQILVTVGVIDMPVWPFRLLAFAYPAFLLIRNAIARKKYFRAEAALARIGVESPKSVLFRCSGEEIDWISANAENEFGLREKINSLTAGELRWKVIAKRFLKVNPNTGRG